MPLFGPKRSTKKFPTMKNIISRRAIARIGVFAHQISAPFWPPPNCGTDVSLGINEHSRRQQYGKKYLGDG